MRAKRWGRLVKIFIQSLAAVGYVSYSIASGPRTGKAGTREMSGRHQVGDMAIAHIFFVRVAQVAANGGGDLVNDMWHLSASGEMRAEPVHCDRDELGRAIVDVELRVYL